MSVSLFPSDQSGTFWTVGAMIGLILCGITLTVVVDENMNDAERAEEEGQPALEEISRLKLEISNLQQLERDRLERQGVSEELRGVIGQLVERTVEVEELEAAVEAQEEWTEKRGKEFQDYQVAYRRSVWARAIGRTLGKLEAKDGREFQEAKITKVSAEGISIGHATGATKLEVHLLPKTLREELLLDLAESQRIAREKREAALAAIKMRRAEQAPSPKSGRTRPTRNLKSRLAASEEADRAEILSLREQIAGLSVLLARITAELPEARARASGKGRQRSVPGSLETWEERELRLLKVEARTRAKLAQLDSQLQLLDPRYRPPYRP